MVFYNSINNWGCLDNISKCVLNEIEVFQGDIRCPQTVRSLVNDIDNVMVVLNIVIKAFER